jgi:DNA primase
MSVWEDIKSRLSVEEVIADYVPIQKVGQNYRCHCPFHNDKTPSLIISPSKGIWHCFGCGAGGDIFKFVMEIENISKAEALQKLAKKAGVECEEYQSLKEQQDPSKTQQNLDWQALGLNYLEWVSEIYHRVLLKLYQDRQHPVTQYCLQRALDLETVKKFKLGYAPKGGFLVQLAQRHRLNLNILHEIGVLKNSSQTTEHEQLDQPASSRFGPTKTGVETAEHSSNQIIRSQNNLKLNQFKDKFSDRLMIPIFDDYGKTVGFTGRVLPYDKTDRPKYLNSPQTDWFNKSEIWYGLHLARPLLNRQKIALIVEGNMDVISAFKHGHQNALASQGTSFTEQQMKILARLVRVVHLAFDNDQAGQMASEKFFKMASKVGLEVERVLVPDKFKDLDEFLGSEEYKQNPRLKTTPYLEYRLQLDYGALTSPNASTQKQAITNYLELLTYLDSLSQEIYLQKLSQLTKIGQTTLQFILSQNLGQKQTPAQSLVPNSEVGYASPIFDSGKNLRQPSPILVNFQKIAALKLAKPELQYKNLELMFQILQVYLDQLANFISLDDYLEQNKPLLDMIASQELSQVNQSTVDQIWQVLTTFIDSKVSAIMLQDDLKEKYYQLKRMV